VTEFLHNGLVTKKEVSFREVLENAVSSIEKINKELLEGEERRQFEIISKKTSELQCIYSSFTPSRSENWINP